MEWKQAYAEACIDAIRPAGDILQLGFVDGYAAAHIQTYSPISHTIIESDPQIAAEAREWAAAFPGVTIIEDSWQLALFSLGKFDAIYVGEHCLEPSCGTPKSTNFLLRAGKALVENIFKKFANLRDIKYTDADVDFFLKKLENKRAEDKKMLPRFFADLYKQGQITTQQWDRVCAELIKRKWVSEEEMEHTQAVTRGPVENSDALFALLDLCLESHMNNGARFSCYLENPTSKCEDPRFQEEVILNPSLDYTERWIDTQGLKGDQDYPFDQALVITIIKVI